MATSSDRNSRLQALEKLGVIDDYSAVQRLGVCIVGIGGVGSVVADHLCRCGVRTLLLVDCDTVEDANLNRSFYLPRHVGTTKVAAAKEMLAVINSSVDVHVWHGDITTMAGFAWLSSAVAAGPTICTLSYAASTTTAESKPPPSIDLVISCVDNFAARLSINRACLVAGRTWMEAGVSESALDGHIQTLVPGITACYECAPPLAVTTSQDERTIIRGGVCAASLPTVMGIIAGLLSQNVLKWALRPRPPPAGAAAGVLSESARAPALGLGPVAMFTSYSSRNNHFAPDMMLRPNPECPCSQCQSAQAKHAVTGNASEPWLQCSSGFRSAAPETAGAEKAAAVRHVDNEWGIEAVAEPGGSTPAAGAESSALAAQADDRESLRSRPTTDGDTDADIAALRAALAESYAR